MTEIRLLGELCVQVNDRPVELGHARQRMLLASLLVDAGRLVTVDQLIDRVWSDRPPQRVRSVVYTYLSRLRAALHPSDALVIERRPGGYLVLAASHAIDINRFRRLVRQARTSDAMQAAHAYEQALGLWRGSALAGLHTAWLDTERDRLHRERLAAQLDYFEVALRIGRASQLLPDLLSLAAEHPLDERLAGQLMLALHWSGRQADALERYRVARHLLTRELGVSPSTRLDEVHRRVLTGEPPPTGVWEVDADGDRQAERTRRATGGYVN
ncbi:AfsR/SARP family transcriptional regulator [Micromonospora wenchangensis]|uniref:AfsR/SARP family transcriptional regulator n=1 Tax=Micromonospora wenchangensis TaxID=1185415 RepID=UPI0037F4DC4A